MNVAAWEKRAGVRIDWIDVQKKFKIGMALAIAFAAGGWWNSIHVREQQLPYLERSAVELEGVKRATGSKPLAVINCLHKKADAAEHIAEQAVSTNGTPADRQALENLPNCPHPKTAIQPQRAAVPKAQ